MEMQGAMERRDTDTHLSVLLSMKLSSRLQSSISTMGTFIPLLLILILALTTSQLCYASGAGMHQEHRSIGVESSKQLRFYPAVSSIIPELLTTREPRMQSRIAEVYELCPRSFLMDSTTVGASSDKSLPFWALEAIRNGDWSQLGDSKPIMSYAPIPKGNGTDHRRNWAKSIPVQLASFGLLDHSASRNMPSTQTPNSKALNVSGFLQLAITCHSSLYHKPQRFEMMPGLSKLTVELQGVWLQKEDEYSLCMLGCTKFPKESQPSSLEQDCHIMTQMHFPKNPTLTNSATWGEVTSLLQPGEKHYFSPVSIRAQRNGMRDYTYTVQNISSQVCINSCSGASVVEDRFKGPGFCSLADILVNGQVLDLEPHLDCDISEEYCHSFGPFGSPAPKGGDLPSGRLLIQNLRCSNAEPPERLDPNDDGIALVSGLFRAVLGDENPYLADQRTGLNNLTLVAEGVRRSDTGEACMIACRGDIAVKNVTASCDIKICLQIFTGLSLRRRTLLGGTISSTKAGNETGNFNSLSFTLPLRVQFLPHQSQIHYNFNHIAEAGAVLDRFEPNSGRRRIKQTVFQYPSLLGKSENDYLELSAELSIFSEVIPYTKQQQENPLYMSFDVIAIEDHVTIERRDIVPLDFSVAPSSALPQDSQRIADDLKVAGELKIGSPSQSWKSYVTEGWYKPKDGKLYMVGCRPVNANWTVLQDNKDFLENRLDCSLDIILEYPSSVVRWLSRQTLKATVQSRRNADDLFYFNTTIMETLPIVYKSQREEIFSRKILEGGLTVATLSIMLVCIGAQSMHMNRNQQSASYVSLAMLTVQAFGYVIPLITGAEAFFARMRAGEGVMTLQNSIKEGEWTSSIMFLSKTLTLIAFILILRLIEKAWKERLTQASKEESINPAPRESNVILFCGIVHLVSFLIILAIHVTDSHSASASLPARFSQSAEQNVLQKEFKEYWGLIEDLFLFPQVVGNAVWDVKGSPLHPMYYIGVTVLRLLPHLYDKLRRPYVNPFYGHYIYANPTSDFYNRAGDIVIPALASILVIVVFVQQRWKDIFALPKRSVYSRLPLKNTEMELSSGLQPQGRPFSVIAEEE